MFNETHIGRKVISKEKGIGTIIDIQPFSKNFRVMFDNDSYNRQWYYRADGVLVGYDGYPDKNITLWGGRIMHITKDDIGKKVITEDGEIGTIVGLDSDDTEGLPVEVQCDDGTCYWYPIDGSTEDTGLSESARIKFLNEGDNDEHTTS
jgi:hypothetical protein